MASAAPNTDGIKVEGVILALKDHYGDTLGRTYTRYNTQQCTQRSYATNVSLVATQHIHPSRSHYHTIWALTGALHMEPIHTNAVTRIRSTSSIAMATVQCIVYTGVRERETLAL